MKENFDLKKCTELISSDKCFSCELGKYLSHNKLLEELTSFRLFYENGKDKLFIKNPIVENGPYIILFYNEMYGIHFDTTNDYFIYQPADIVNGKKINIFDIDGNILSDVWFDSVECRIIENRKFTNRFWVILDKKYNVFDAKSKKLLFDEWLDIHDRIFCETCFREGINIIKKKGKYNFLDENEQLVYDTWFDNLEFIFTSQISEKFYTIIGDKIYILDGKNKKILLPGEVYDNQFFKYFENEYALINQMIFIKKDGTYKILFPNKNIDIIQSNNDYYLAGLCDKNNYHTQLGFLNKNGEFLPIDEWKEWYLKNNK